MIQKPFYAKSNSHLKLDQSQTHLLYWLFDLLIPIHCDTLLILV